MVITVTSFLGNRQLYAQAPPVATFVSPTPADGATNVALEPVFKITTSYNIDSSSVTWQMHRDGENSILNTFPTFMLIEDSDSELSDSAKKFVSRYGVYQKVNDTTLSFSPKFSLKFNTKYRLILKNLKVKINGNSTSVARKEMIFTTALPPHRLVSSSLSGQSMAKSKDTIELKFNRPIHIQNASSIITLNRFVIDTMQKTEKRKNHIQSVPPTGLGYSSVPITCWFNSDKTSIFCKATYGLETGEAYELFLNLSIITGDDASNKQFVFAVSNKFKVTVAESYNTSNCATLDKGEYYYKYGELVNLCAKKWCSGKEFAYWLAPGVNGVNGSTSACVSFTVNKEDPKDVTITPIYKDELIGDSVIIDIGWDGRWFNDDTVKGYVKVYDDEWKYLGGMGRYRVLRNHELNIVAFPIGENFVFTRWSGSSNSNNQILTIRNPNGKVEVRANFGPRTLQPPSIIGAFAATIIMQDITDNTVRSSIAELFPFYRADSDKQLWDTAYDQPTNLTANCRVKDSCFTIMWQETSEVTKINGVDTVLRNRIVFDTLTKEVFYNKTLMASGAVNYRIGKRRSIVEIRKRFENGDNIARTDRNCRLLVQVQKEDGSWALASDAELLNSDGLTEKFQYKSCGLTKLRLIPIVTDGFLFVGWDSTEDDHSSNDTFEFTLNKNMKIKAIFKEDFRLTEIAVMNNPTKSDSIIIYNTRNGLPFFIEDINAVPTVPMSRIKFRFNRTLHPEVIQNIQRYFAVHDLSLRIDRLDRMHYNAFHVSYYNGKENSEITVDLNQQGVDIQKLQVFGAYLSKEMRSNTGDSLKNGGYIFLGTEMPNVIWTVKKYIHKHNYDWWSTDEVYVTYAGLKFMPNGTVDTLPNKQRFPYEDLDVPSSAIREPNKTVLFLGRIDRKTQLAANFIGVEQNMNFNLENLDSALRLIGNGLIAAGRALRTINGTDTSVTWVGNLLIGGGYITNLIALLGTPGTFDEDESMGQIGGEVWGIQDWWGANVINEGVYKNRVTFPRGQRFKLDSDDPEGKGYSIEFEVKLN